MDFVRLFRARRIVLWAVAAASLVGLNGVFLYYAFARPDLLADALANPISLVFILEASVLTAFGAWAVMRAGLRRPGWGAFVVLSVVGSLAFSVPAFVLWHLRARTSADTPER
jgi:hypothetical protein